jgi:hypothetical protein
MAPRRRNPLNIGLDGFNAYGSAWVSAQLAHFFFSRMTERASTEVCLFGIGRAGEWTPERRERVRRAAVRSGVDRAGTGWRFAGKGRISRLSQRTSTEVCPNRAREGRERAQGGREWARQGRIKAREAKQGRVKRVKAREWAGIASCLPRYAC